VKVLWSVGADDGNKKMEGEGLKKGRAHVDILKTLQTFWWWPPPTVALLSQPSSATKRNWLDGFVGVGMGIRLVVRW
jgi:hypothetical protein